MDLFEGLLHELHSSHEDSFKAKTIICKISNHFKAGQNDSSTDLLIFLLFGENGLISFINKALRLEVHKSNILNIFSLMEFLLVNYEKFCTPYVEEVKKLCLRIIHHDVPAKIKENSLKLLKCVFAPSYIVTLDLSNIMSTITHLRDDLPPSVQAQLFSVTGIIFEKMPEVSENENDFLNYFLKKMKGGRKSGVSVISGCLEGINGYLVNFVPNPEQISDIYLCLKEFCFVGSRIKDATQRETRKAAERAALRIINRHYRVFAVHIYKDIEYWHKILNYRLEKSKEDRHLGFGGLVAVYKSVAYICNSSEQDVPSGNLESIVNKLLSRQPNFNTASTIGLVELISTGHVREELANQVLYSVTKRFSSKNDSSMYLSLNLECISKYLTKTNTIKEDYLIQIQRMAVALIDAYPKTDTNFKRFSLEALEKSFYYVERCGSHEFNEYVKEVVYQGLIRSCSYQTYDFTEIQKEIMGKELVSHKSFLPLWIHITNLGSSNTDLEHFESKNTISCKVLDEYIASFLKINKKLDLRFHIENQYVSSGETTVEASRPNDWQIFINNVNLFVDIMEEADDLHRMKKSLMRILLEAIDSAYGAPLIGEYYKIVIACLRIANNIQFFDDCPANEKIVQRFLRNVSLRVGEYKGETQISCFRTLLAAPARLIESFAKDLVPVFKIIVQVSSGHFSLLKECVLTLERWFRSSPGEGMEFLLKSILPYFDVFLQSKSETASRVSDSKRKPLKISGHTRNSYAINTDNELLHIQKKFLLFLGSLNTDVSKHLLETKGEEDSEEDEECVNSLSYDLPLSDGSLRIRVEFLPRVIELALSAGDRCTRIRACEFLHSAVALTLGNMKTMNGELNGLFRKLVPLCLLLACDSDNKIRQIYEILVTQMVHYFAGRERNISETEIFIDCLMKSVSHPYNSTLRDVAARLIREFVKWSLKTVTSSSEICSYVKLILKSMYLLSIHPNYNNRRGAAIVFNNIHSLIKDETDLLNTHWFLFYYHFMEGLSMCMLHDDTSHITNAIELIRMSLKGKDLNTYPKVPPGFKDNYLNTLMKWIFSRCSHHNPKIRKLSMSTVEDFSQDSVKEFIAVHVTEIYTTKECKIAYQDKGDHSTWLNYCSSLFDYYSWLLIHDAVTEQHLKNSGVEELLDLFLDKLTTIKENIVDAAVSLESLSILHMLEFLVSSISRNIILYNRKVLELLRICIYRPSQYEFEVCDLESREKLCAILKVLIPKIVSVLKDSEITYLLNPDEYFSPLQHLGEYLQNRKPLWEMVELLNGLKMINGLELWDAGMRQKVSGNEILRLVFNSIFTQRPRRCSGFLIEAHDKMFLDDFIKFGIEIGISLDVVLDLLKNVEEVIEEETFKKTTKGEYFMDMFKDELLDYFIQNSEIAVDEIMLQFPKSALIIVFNTLNHGGRTNLSFGYKKKFISELCRRWEKLTELPDNKKILLLSIVRSMCQIIPEVLVEECSIRDWFFKVVATTESLLSEEAEIIFGLFLYVSPVNEDFNEGITCTLDKIFKNLGFFTSESDNPDPKVATAYKGLLNSFTKTRSLSVLQGIIKILKKYKKLQKENEIEKTAANICQGGMYKVTNEHLKRILTFLYGELFSKYVTPDEICECIFLKLLQKSDSAFAWTYFLEILDDLLGVLKGENLVHKISALKIMQTCVVKVKRKELENVSDKEKEAFRSCISICSKIPSTEDSELLRKYVCCCFNVLCTVISTKSDDQRLYKSLIFKEDFSFLPRMISQMKKWVLRMDFDELPKRRKVLIALRKSITKERQIKLGKTIGSIQYLHRETLYHSSLNEDVTRFDLSNLIIRPIDSLPKTEVGEHYLELEMDELNNHECMPTLVGIIRHMVDEGITSPASKALPFWLSSMMKRMTSLNSSENEKIFLLKVMCNTDEYIKPYAEFIVSDLLHTLVEVFQEKPINYLITDVITMILNWKLDWILLNRQLKASFTQLAVYIIKKSDAYRKDIIESNLEIAKLLVETCKENMNLDILSMHAFRGLETCTKFPTGDKDVLSYLNFQFCGILLANSIPAWTENKEEDFMRMVLGYFGEEKNGRFAAEICGLCLKYLKSNAFRNTEKLLEMTRGKVQHIKSSHSVYDLPLIYAIYKNFPEFCSNFVATLRNSAWNLKGQLRTQSLEMLLSYMKTVNCPDQSMFGSTIYNFLLDMLSPDDFEALSVSLQMVEVFSNKAADDRMNAVFEKALSFGDYRISRVRKSVYNIAATLFEKWDERYSGKISENVRRMCKIVLINGMNDKELDLSETCLEFWYLRTRGSKSGAEFAKILCELYTPETEKGFFNFAAKLMIRSAAHGPDYGKCIFEHPLVSNSTFETKMISTGSYYSSIVPTFSATLSGSLNQSSLLLQENEDGLGTDGIGSGVFKQRKRFVKDPKKLQRYFAKKKTALEEELGRKKASGNDIDLLREYKDGDFPYVQITHSDLLKPLEELTMLDPQIGRYFLTSLYNGFAENITDETKEIIVKLGELVCQIFEENPSSDPAIIAFMFYILMHCGWHVKVGSNTISKVAKSSGWLSVGGLLIEDLITLGEVEEPVIRRKGITEEEKSWLHLVELTRCLKEFEVLRGILIDKLRVGTNTCEAIRYESVSDWFNAAKFYEAALERGESSLSDFCVDAYLNSLARLSDWTKLNTYVRNTYEMNDLWSNASLFEKVLPWFMKSATIQSETSNLMFTIVSGAEQEPERENVLKKFFVEELTVFHFLNGKSQWAEYYLHQMCLKFLSNWSHWNKWSNKLRLSRLVELQLFAEVDQCLKVFKEDMNVEVSRMVDLWSRNNPKDSDDLMNWDLKLTLRNNCLSKLRSSFPDLDIRKIRESVVMSEFDLVKSGIAQKNVQISEKYLNVIEQDLKKQSNHKLQLMHNYYISSLEILKEEVYEKDKNIRLKRIVDASCQLQRQMTSVMDTSYNDCNLFFYECNMKLSKVMHLLQSYEEESLDYAATVLGVSRSKIKEDICEKELKYLHSARRVIEGVDAKLLSETYIEIVKYHRRLAGYNKQLAKCLFRAMSLGNIEARSLFCYLLNEINLAEDWVTDQEMKSCFETVPVWMFVKWMNQILANLDSKMFPFLRDVLWSLVEEYPNSVRYAFELSKNNYRYNHEYGGECLRFVDDLSETLLSDIHHRDFLTALSFVVAPDLILKYDIYKLYAEIKSSSPNWDTVTGIVRDLYERMYGEELKRFRGPAFDCLTKIKHDIELLLSLGQEHALWQEKLENIMKSMPKCNLDDSLKQCSPWLYNFHTMNQNIRIELPGQYTGDQKPIPKDHVFISSFRHRVLVMNSKCKPIRISILGDNAREYRFLVKFGEDLRQDQRIQQVFSHMNYVLRENPQTFPHYIDTYKVIPLKCNLGLIEWVRNTVSLYEMLVTPNPSVKKTMEMVQKLHLEFLAQDNNVDTVATAYLNGFKRINRNNAVARFAERVHSFEWDLLRKAFWNLSTYPEQFAYLRKNFASSEAVIFIAHWLIGIGDRHLDNTLISSRTGRALGIDFGCAFGFATEFLTPPELIPFRLTPQIISLMKPMGTSGLIKEVMIHCLKAFCREKSMLLATLEVFASEPALDWLEKARRDNTCTKTSDWSPWKKIVMVKEKLEGANPVKIFSDDLKSGHSDSECLEKYLEVLRGDGSRCCKSCLTVEEQVDCLIDLASDYHVLSKTYVGWNPWL